MCSRWWSITVRHCSALSFISNATLLTIYNRMALKYLLPTYGILTFCRSKVSSCASLTQATSQLRQRPFSIWGSQRLIDNSSSIRWPVPSTTCLFSILRTLLYRLTNTFTGHTTLTINFTGSSQTSLPVGKQKDSSGFCVRTNWKEC
jgi:hypothetical protein